MLLANGLLGSDVLRWKAIGAATWLAVVTIAAAAAWGVALAPALLLSPFCLVWSLFNPSAWMTAMAAVMAQAPAFAAQAATLRSSEPRPPHAHRLLGWPRAAAASVLLSKLTARADSVAAAARTATFAGLHLLSALMFLSLDSATRSSAPNGASWTLQYGAWLAVLYVLHWAYWSQDVVLFPSVQRHRYFRLKQRLPTAAAHAAKLAAAAFVAASGTTLLRARALAPSAQGGGAAAWPPTLGGSAAALLAGSLCVFCWLAGSAALEVVFSERLRPDDYSDRDVLAAMAACLAGKKGDLMRALALHDTSCLASEVGKAALRRADIFADDSGDRWRPIAAACIAELDSLSASVAAALAQQKPSAPAGGAGGAGSTVTQHTHKWNVLPSALASKGGLGSSKQQLEALLAVRCGYPRATLAANALAGFATASLKEDRFGVLQLTQPGLGEVLLCLLSALGATQQLLRSSASLASRQLSLGPWRGDGDCVAFAACYRSQAPDAAALPLHDILTVALYRIAATFGDGLIKVLADCKAAPAFGSASDAKDLLQRVLSGQA